MIKRASKRISHDRKDVKETVLPLGIKSKTRQELYLEKNVLGEEKEFIKSIQKPIQSLKRKSGGFLLGSSEERSPVWHDYNGEEDSRMGKINGTKDDWARLSWQKNDPQPDSDEEESSLLKHTGNYMGNSQNLPKNIILVKSCSDANKEYPSKERLTSVQFHPAAQVVLVAGMDRRISLFQVDGKNNTKVQSIFLNTFPIYKARFSHDGKQVIMSSRLRSFYYYDMISGTVVNVPKIKGLEEKQMAEFEISPDGNILVFLGQQGHIHLLSAKTKELIDTVKMNGNVESVAFSPDGSKMFSFGDDGDVYVWDMKNRQCMHRFHDEGSFNGSSIAVSNDLQYLATGSQSGVVNIYDVNSVTVSRTPKPLKTLMNLTSPCTSLKFNSTSEILAASSNFAENAVKLIHLPSFAVFQNFPDTTISLRKPQCLDFSLHSGYFSIANHKGQALLYRLKHYSDY